MTLTTTIHQLEHHLTNQPLPKPWRTHPDLASNPTIGELIAVIRDYRHPIAGDRSIRTLLALPSGSDPDPRMIVIAALAPHTLGRLTAHQIDPDETLTELATVICDPGPIDHLDRLYNRLARRAASRTLRARYGTCHNNRQRTHLTDHDTLTTIASRHSPAFDDPADLAIDRAALTAFRAAAEDAVDRGELSPVAWANYRDGILAHAFDSDTGRRYHTPTTRRRLAALVQQQLAA